MSGHVVVIGGGFAGAAAASALAEAGVPVTLLEQRAVLGGRTVSHRDGVTGEEIDNGQHLFLGCYDDTRRFLRRLRVADRLAFFPSLRIPFYSAGGRRAELARLGLPGGAGLLAGLLAFPELTFGQRWAALRAGLSLGLRRPKDLADITVAEWLDRLRQPAGLRRSFWTPLCLATLNAGPETACAAALDAVLRQGLLGPAHRSSLGYATVSLSKLWPMELANFLKPRGGVVASRQTAAGFELEGSLVARVRLQGGETVEADAVVCAAPVWSFLKICPEPLRARYRGLQAAQPSPILSVHLWYSKPPLRDAFAGLLDVEAQWIFNRARLWRARGSEGYVSLVYSGAADLARKTGEELISLAKRDVKRCFPEFDGELRHGAALWEKEATPAPTPAFWKARPPVQTELENLFLAGDWVDTGLPPTIEAAARAGHRAADLARAYLASRHREEAHA
jgi:hydroxysqualene dehydroxylase